MASVSVSVELYSHGILLTRSDLQVVIINVRWDAGGSCTPLQRNGTLLNNSSGGLVRYVDH